MQKKFRISWTKIKGGCQSGSKVITHNSKSDLTLILVLIFQIFDFVCYKSLENEIGPVFAKFNTQFYTILAILQFNEKIECIKFVCFISNVAFPSM